MLTVTQVRKGLEDRNLEAVARKLDIHPNTLRNIYKGVNEPSYQILEKLSNYLEAPIDAV